MHSSGTEEVVSGFGHENILATHKTTVEFTKDAHLSKKGDCIIAVCADKSVADLSPKFRANLRKPYARLMIRIESGGVVDLVQAYGVQQLILSHPTDMVIRKSGYVCSRTLAVRANKAAADLSRALVDKLRNPRQRVKITLTLSF